MESSDGKREEELAQKETTSEQGAFDIASAIKDIAAVFPMGTRVIMTDASAVKWQLDGDVLHAMVKTDFNRKALSAPDKKARIENRFEELYGRKIRVLVSEMPEEKRTARDIEELRKFDIVQFR